MIPVVAGARAVEWPIGSQRSQRGGWGIPLSSPRMHDPSGRDKNGTHFANCDSKRARLFQYHRSYMKGGKRLVDQPIDLDSLA